MSTAVFGKDHKTNQPQPIRGKEGALIVGSSNPAREAQSTDTLCPPPTDVGTMPSLKRSFTDSCNRLQAGGWARQTTVREMPFATELARLDKHRLSDRQIDVDMLLLERQRTG